MRFAEHVDAPDPGSPLASPGLVLRLVRRAFQRPQPPVPGDQELQVTERLADRGEAGCRHSDLYVVMLPGHLLPVQVQRPAARHIPRDLGGREPPRQLSRRPRLPARICQRLTTGWQAIIHAAEDSQPPAGMTQASGAHVLTSRAVRWVEGRSPGLSASPRLQGIPGLRAGGGCGRRTRAPGAAGGTSGAGRSSRRRPR